MKTIQIDDDVHAFLLANVRELGEDASKILRRLLKISETPPHMKKRPEYLFSPDNGPARPSSPLEECILEPKFQYEQDAVGRFLYILSWLHKKHPKDFNKILGIRGRTRRYFATSAEALEESGNSVNPQRIPDSSYWVVTNNDTPKKQRILWSVIQRLGYPTVDGIKLGEALE